MSKIFVLAALPLVVSFFQIFMRSKRDDSTAYKISSIIRKAAMRYFVYQSIAAFLVSILLVIVIFVMKGDISIYFFLGSFSCIISAFFNINVATLFNVECAKQAESHSIGGAFRKAFQSGIVSSLFSSSLAVLSMLLTKHFSPNDLMYVVGGYLTSGLVIRIMGGVFTKSADIGTDLVGKIENNIPEDSPQNPGVIADNVGDNVGDCCGMASCSLGTYVATIGFLEMFGGLGMESIAFYFIAGLSASALASGIMMKSWISSILGMIPMIGLNAYLIIEGYSIYNLIPMIVFGILGVISYVVAPFIIKQKLEPNKSIEAKFSVFIPMTIIVYVVQLFCMKDLLNLGLWDYNFIIGSGAFLILALKVIELFTSASYSPIQSAIKSSVFGAGMTVISGMKLSHLLVLIISIFFLIISFGRLDLQNGLKYSMLVLGPVLPAVLSQDCFGAVTDNAGGIVEMSDLGKQSRDITDSLDMVGNMVKAITKVYVTLGTMSSFGLLMYTLLLRTTINPTSVVLSIITFGFSYGFSSIVMKFVRDGAFAVANNIRVQFMTNPGILSGTSNPNYGSVIDVISETSIKAMTLIFLSLVVYIAISVWLFGKNLFFVESIGFISGCLMSLDHNVAGAIYDNMKKGREIVGITKKSDQYAALVNADLVGDVLKDATGPGILVLMKFKLIMIYLLFM